MKTSQDPRHLKRKKMVKALFAWDFIKKGNPLVIKDITTKIKKIDQMIIKAAPEWPIGQINRIDLAILRLSVWELKIEKKQPEKVIIDEAVELAKSYGAEKSPGFINGVLGTILKENGSKKTRKED